MSLVSHLARPLLAVAFVNNGVKQLRDPGAAVDVAAPLSAKLARTVPVLAKDPATLVRANALAQVGGGMLLSSGRFPRVGAAVLIASLVPTTWAAHAYWTEDDAMARRMQKEQFEKNLAILGGLLLAAAAPGRPVRRRRASASQAAGHPATEMAG
jgi:putative oxidoreductase